MPRLLSRMLQYLSLNKEMANDFVALKLMEHVLSAAYETFYSGLEEHSTVTFRVLNQLDWS